MKNKIVIVLLAFISLFCFSCSSQLCLQKRTDRLIKKSHKNTDTVYLYSVAFNNFKLIWYHKDGFIHPFIIEPCKIITLKPNEAKNITISSDSINKYFDPSVFYKDILCFEDVLDGGAIRLYMKGKSYIHSSIDTECLFNTKFEANSFPYKLQYDFSKMFKNPGGFDFEKMYTDEGSVPVEQCK